MIPEILGLMNAYKKKSMNSHKNIILAFFLTSSLFVISIAGSQNNDPSAPKSEALKRLPCYIR
jgi:hypothetical protein